MAAARSLLLLALLSHVVRAEKTALLVVDVQNCFLSGGTLAVTNGNDVISIINEMRAQHGSQFDLIVMSKDWHCTDHVSFYTQHSGKNMFDIIQLNYNVNGTLCAAGLDPRSDTTTCNQVVHSLNQTLWPEHCIAGTTDADLSTSLMMSEDDVIVLKGYRCNIDAYSVFSDNGGFAQTELHQVLQNAGITKLIITGLALDYCVLYTAKDAQNLGYSVFVVLDATRPVAEATGTAAVTEMKNQGIMIINSADIGSVVSGAATWTAIWTLHWIGLFISCVLTKCLH